MSTIERIRPLPRTGEGCRRQGEVAPVVSGISGALQPSTTTCECSLGQNSRQLNGPNNQVIGMLARYFSGAILCTASGRLVSCERAPGRAPTRVTLAAEGNADSPGGALCSR